jgi:hypothetical protein
MSNALQDHTDLRPRIRLALWPVFVLCTALLTACIAPITTGSALPVEAPPPDPTATSAAAHPDLVPAEFLPAERPPSHLVESDWRTDFTRRTVPWSEILSGGPPKDGIPAIDDPTFESSDDARAWLTARDPVILVQHKDDARAYPLAILIWHEIANDTIGGLPVAVTFCPLCNASIVFDRTFAGQVLDFGTTGLLRNSDLIMYDRQSETWWQQFTGRGIVGAYAGQQLRFLHSQVISFDDFAAHFPKGKVLARPSLARPYGDNPYTGYDSLAGRPFLYTGELDDRLPPTERIVGVSAGDSAMAYPFSALTAAGVIHDEIGGDKIPIVIFHRPGVASALDTRDISEGRDIGSVAVYDRRLGDRTLTFAAVGDGTFRDRETGSVWNILGMATAGELAGQRLAPLLAFDHFWFAWAAFFPETGLYVAP